MRSAKFLVMAALCLAGKISYSQQAIPVDLVTGAAQLTIPLTELQYGDITVPVALVYNATGVKPQQVSDFYGANWQLIASGEVRRELRGLPDDYKGAGSDLRKGWLIDYATQINNFNFTSDDNLAVCTDELNDWTFVNDLAYVRDPEPDIFTFSAPGLNGRFVFGADKLPKTMPYQDLKFEFNPSALDNKITSIKITKPDGTQYTFNNAETIVRDADPDGFVSQFKTQYQHYKTAIEYTAAWRLTSIKSARGALVTFCYGNTCRNSDDMVNRERISSAKNEVRLSSTSSNASSAPNKQYTITDIIKTTDLVAISSPAGKVYFDAVYSYLKSITVSAKGSGVVKRYGLNYISVKNPTEQYGKYFLKEIVEMNGNCEAFPAYKFEYYDVVFGAFAGTTSMVFDNPNVKQDLWGYFNDAAVSKNPTVYYYAAQTGAERYRFYPITGQTATQTINGADRTVKPAKIISGSLKSLTLPTGSVTTITYEPNQYHDAVSNVVRYGPGLRVKRIVSTENPITAQKIADSEDLVVDYEYLLPDGKSSGKWIYPSVFGYHDVQNFYATLDDQSPESLILYNRVKVKRSGRGETVYDYYMPGMYPLTTAPPDWNATQTKFARGTSSPSCTSPGELKKHYFSHPFPVSTNYDFERGLIYKITEFNNGGIRAKETKYSYQRLSSPVALVKGLKYEFLSGTTNLATGANSSSNTFVFGKYTLLANLGKVMLTETVRVPDMADTSKYFETASTYTHSSVHNMLQKIETTNSDGNVGRTTFTYAKDFSGLTQPLATNPNAVSIKKLNDNFMHGMPVEVISTIVKGSTPTVTRASVTLYSEVADSTGGTSRILPREIRTYAGGGSYAQAAVSPPSGSNQVLSVNSYAPSSFYDEYDFIGNPLSVRNISRQVSGVHLGYNKTVPVASFSNNAAKEALYDGFDTYSDFGFTTISAGLSYPAGRTGARSIQLASGKLIERSGIVKGVGTHYRYGIWVFAAAARTVTLKTLNGSTVVNTVSLSYVAGDANKWKYYEGLIPVSALPSSFGFRVEANNTTRIDDVSFYPSSSSVNIASYTPIVGKTSQTDTRGVTEFYEYDGLGRMKFVNDQDGNLRQSHDYYYRAMPVPQLSASFYASHAPHQVVKNATVNYTVQSNNCGVSPLTYAWYVNDVLLGSATTFSYTFSQEQKYVVRLVVTHPTYGAVANSLNYDVKAIGTGNITAGVSTQSNSYAFCDANHTKVFTVALGGCYVLPSVEIKWFYKIGGTWYEVPYSENPGNLTYTFDPIIMFNGVGNMAAYSVRCEVSTTCPVTGVYATSSSEVNISYNGSTICQ